MNTICIQSWDEFVRLTSQLDGWAFRGHQDESWPLSSSLTRYLMAFAPNTRGWRAREERAIRIFRRKAHNYLPDPTALDEDLRCLALMQHHGAPTRLLDFTKSPFVAAFFAMEKATANAAVYALNTPKLYNATPVGRPELTRDAVDPRLPGNFNHHFLDSDEEVIWIGEPTRMDRRLVAQSGTFVVPGLIDKSLDQILDRYSSKEPLISKIILPQAMREEAMRALYRMNVTNATLFPDLDGLARSIAFELEIIWPGLIDGSGQGSTMTETQ
jgi:hypothetical protein